MTKILCSGDLYHEPIEAQECLDCAIKMKGKQPCGYGYRLLKAMFATQEDRTQEIHVTDITSCLLKAFLDKKFPSPRFVHDGLAMFIGHAVHNALDTSDAHVLSEVPVGGLGLVGRLDAEYVADGRIEDAKTKRWIKPSQLHSEEHQEQVNIYRHLRGSGAGMQIQYIDMSGPSKCRGCKITMRLIGGEVRCPKCGGSSKENHLGAMIVDVAPIEDTEGLINERVAILQEALNTDIAPRAEPGWICGYCPHMTCAYNTSIGE